MGKIYAAHPGGYERITGYLEQGVDPTTSDFALETFRRMIAGKRNQICVFLMDQSLISAIGNAYADEILFEAGIHPKTRCHDLDPTEVERLYSSVGKTLRWGIEEVARAGRPIETKVRDHMRVRARKGEPCPVCGTTIRRTGVLGHDSFFCPACQPAKDSQFIPWGASG